MSSLKADFDELRERIRHGRELGHPSGRLPLHLEDLFWRENQVVDRLEARMAELAPVADALAQFVEISFE